MKNNLYGCDIVSMQDLPLSRIKLILETAARLKSQRALHLLKNKVIAHCFFEPSTRTRLSFEAATLQLGGSVIGFSSDEALSIRKGETLHDTIRIVSEYADLIIIRHPKEGAARLAADVSNKPVINAGDGANQHPTQALLDLFTIQECQQRLDGLAIALVGDLKYGRTIHSFAQACMLFNIRLFLVAPDALALPESICDTLKKVGVRFSFHQSIEEVIPKVDVLYMTRIQQERFSEAEYQAIRKQYILTPDMLSSVRPNLKILHPLPRVNEIDTGVDETPYAHYFQQAANGIYVRQALLTLLLNKE
ncbi:Aspartate carbamoyltransferase [Aquicella siphonis]|uniref:Aspartate carbamoyltransferase n=1 Tax=Aquicella siphonis TaxID=254247 RepID=A0A5E4PDV0_9COXI|nr:aspartate carbamoyltransferase [Aquicella siphonis]VVC74765.1 Aspartate carbamoyltransferase [Aquicella siphonis]